MLDKVLRFFISAFMAIAGAALMQLASPVLTMFVSTELFNIDMGLFRITMANLLCILIGAIAGGIIGVFSSPYFIKKIKK